MDRSSKPTHLPSKQRKPLADGTSRGNSARTPPQRGKYRGAQPSSSGTHNLPHNESIVAHGQTLTVRNHGSAANKHLSTIQDEERGARNRDSAVSTASSSMTAGSRRKTHIGPWQLGRTIGEGGCSRVRMVRHAVTGQLGAAKIISKKMADKVKAQSLLNLYKTAETDPSLLAQCKVMPFGLEREIVIMKLLEHRNIVRLYDVWENRNELYLIMEYIDGGELFDYIDVDGGLSEIEIVYIFRQIIAALLYCHRINIHHRDLKPENILIDRSTAEIKLVDFGMAALQPEGRWLTTPCGSPHYAAPEVIRYKSYDGSLADVWSCGVILFVMLTGVPPFTYSGNNEDLPHLFKLIAKAQYVMPDFLSPEAKDLISQILIPDPRKRIRIEGVWNHPFLNKYNEELGVNFEKTRIENWIGATPTIVNWNVTCLEDLDREIVRNMRTLWHDESEQTLLEKLLSPRPNQEKYFYSALVKHRDEHLDTWGGIPEMGYSASDYHHVHNRRGAQPPVPKTDHARTKSQFSILNDEHLRSQHSLQEATPSEKSYDPFRASREPSLANKGNPYMNVTVHRDCSSSSGSRNLKSTVAKNRSQADSLRVEALKKSNWRNSGLSSNGSRSSRRGFPAAGVHRRSSSRASSTSSVWPSSPPVVVRPASSHKRGVSFAHLRKSSTASRLTEPVQHTPEQRSILRCSPEPMPSTPLQPSIPAEQVRSRKEAKATPVAPRIKVRTAETPSRLIEGDVRKASTELEKVLDEAFNNRSSVSSSLRTSTTAPPPNYETPPSSVSYRGSGASAYTAEMKSFETSISQRPLPPLPPTDDSPNTFLARELAVTRDRLAARKALEDRGDADKYDEIIAHLDRLLNRDRAVQIEGARSASAPQPRSPEHMPVISEEGRTPGETQTPNWRAGNRAATAPVSSVVGDKYHGERTDTIRMVDPSSPTPAGHIAPLNIRKVSAVSTTSPAHPAPSVQKQLQVPIANTNTLRRKPSRLSDALTRRSSRETEDEKALLIKEIPKDGKDTKKKSWFRRKFTDNDDATDIKQLAKESKDARSQIPAAWRELDDRMDISAKVRLGAPGPNTNGDSGRGGHAGILKNATFEEFPIRGDKVNLEKSLKKSGLFKWLVKKGEKKGPLELATQSDVSDPSLISSVFDHPEGTPDSMASRAIEGQNWLARFLHIKPATKVLCFHVGRGRVRADIVRLLRDWQPFGVRDITYDRFSNVITARIDKDNREKIKPVSFAIELFTVLEHGRRAQLCLARFTQTRGAVSSFRKVVDVLEDCFNSRGMLIEDEEKKKAMEEVLA